MRIKVQSIAILSLALIATSVIAFEEEIPIHRERLSMDDLSRILSSGVASNRNGLQFDHNDFLQKATDFEWSRAKNAQRGELNENTRKEKTSPVHNLRRNNGKDLDKETNYTENIEDRNLQEDNSDTKSAMFPYIACVQKHGRSGYLCRELVNEVFGEDLVMPLYNNDDMACFITSSLAEVADSVTSPIIVQPLLPEMKVGEDTVRSIEKDYPPPSRFNAFLCPEYLGTDDISVDISKRFFGDLVSNIAAASSNDEHRRSLLSKTFGYYYPKETESHHRHLMWSELFEEGIDSIHHCEDIFSKITHSSSHKNDVITFTIPDSEAYETNTIDPFSRERACVFALLAGLVAKPEICSIEKMDDVVLLNGEAQWIVQSGQDNNRPFFDAGISGEGQVIACSDSGLDTNNCYFWDRTGEVSKNNEAVDKSRRKVVQYVPFADGQAEPSSHGTHVAGSIVGKRAINGGAESNGIADGIAPAAKIAFFDIGDARSTYLRTPSDAADILSPGLKADAKIHSASWGSNFNSYGVQEREIDEFAYENDDFLVVIAAGNSGSRGRWRTDIPGSIGSPATAKNIIAVGASQSAGDGLQTGMLGKDYIATFSSRGPTRDGRTKPEIVAPGYFILSANADPRRTGECDNNGGVTAQAGTSMATPVVSGTAALVRQYLEEGWYPLGRPVASNKIEPSASLVKAILLNGAQPLKGVDNPRGVTQVRPYDNNQGFGRVSLIDSMPLQGENSIRMKIVDRKRINDGQTDSYDITINKNGGCTASELSVTLVWNDPPSVPNCQKCVLNDLDLYLTKVGTSTIIYPNGRSRRDSLNNSERIRIDVNNGDRYRVYVKAYDLDTARQNYALVMTGCVSDDITPSSPTETPTKSPVSPVAPTPTPTLSPINPSTLSSLYTTMLGTYTQAGNMFNVRAEKNMFIRSMNFHTVSTRNVQVEVWTRPGSYRRQEFSSYGWTRIVYAIVRGRGEGNPTPIPEEAFSRAIGMYAGEMRGFYITLNTPDMIYSIGTADGALYVTNGDLSFGEGVAKLYPFGRSFKPRVWNGSFNYEIV